MIGVTLIAIVSIIVVIAVLCLLIQAVVVDYKNEDYLSMIWGVGLILMITSFVLGIILMALNI